MLARRTEKDSVVIILSKEETEALQVALKDAMELHETYDIYSPKTIHSLREIWFHVNPDTI